MKRFIFILLMFIATSGIAEPITSFNNGTFLGEGHYQNSAGEGGSYSSYIQILDNEWSIAYLRDGVLNSYSATFDFTNGGIFEVAVTQYTDEGETSYSGYGYCASVQCHVVVDLGDYVFEETITLATWEEKIYRLGSIRRTSGEDIDTLYWEERLLRIDQ